MREPGADDRVQRRGGRHGALTRRIGCRGPHALAGSQRAQVRGVHSLEPSCDSSAPRLLSLAFAASPVALAAPCAGFIDVDDANPAHAPFCDSVEWMKLRNITLGCTSPTLYCPNGLVTRLQMAAFMYRLGFQNAFLRDGNAFGTAAVLGTTDNHPLDLRVNNARVVRYEPNTISPNVIGGSPANSVHAGVFGATIGGGGVPDPNFDDEGPNRVTSAYGTVAEPCGRDRSRRHHAMAFMARTQPKSPGSSFCGGHRSVSPLPVDTGPDLNQFAGSAV